MDNSIKGSTNKNRHHGDNKEKKHKEKKDEEKKDEEIMKMKLKMMKEIIGVKMKITIKKKKLKRMKMI